MIDANLLNEMIQECELMINILNKRLLVLKQLGGTVSTQGLNHILPGSSMLEEMEKHKQEAMNELRKKHMEMREQIMQTIQTMPARPNVGFHNPMENEQFQKMFNKGGSK